jgi:hypothetical protein
MKAYGGSGGKAALIPSLLIFIVGIPLGYVIKFKFKSSRGCPVGTAF